MALGASCGRVDLCDLVRMHDELLVKSYCFAQPYAFPPLESFKQQRRKPCHTAVDVEIIDASAALGHLHLQISEAGL